MIRVEDSRIEAPVLGKCQSLVDDILKCSDVPIFEPEEFGNFYEEKARRELRETPDVVENALKDLKNSLIGEENLNFPIENEKLLKVFLRPCKFYPESAFEMMQTYYKYRLKHPKYFQDLIPSNEKAAFIQNLLTILPQRNTNGERVLMLEVGQKWKPKSCNLNNIVRAVVMLLEAALEEPRTQVSGAQVILDMDGLSMQHVWQFTPTFAKDIVGFVQESLPVRLKGVHIVNQPYVFNMLFAIFKPFLGTKLRSRIHFHSDNYKTLYEHLDQNILPKKYGGKSSVSLEMGDHLHKLLLPYDESFKEKAKEGYTNGKM